MYNTQAYKYTAGKLRNWLVFIHSSLFKKKEKKERVLCGEYALKCLNIIWIYFREEGVWGVYYMAEVHVFSDSARHSSRDIFPLISQIVMKNFIKKKS